jgi:hypothetical protein
MNIELISTVGMLICLAPAVVHGPEVFSPLLARLPVNWILPFFGPGLPNPRTSLSRDEMLTMLDAARDAAPEGKEVTARDYIFFALFESRQISLASWAVAAGVIYGLTLGVEARAPLHVMFGVLSILFALVNFNHAGIPGLGHHPRVSRNGRHVGIMFAPVWVIAAILNIWAFVGA